MGDIMMDCDGLLEESAWAMDEQKTEGFKILLTQMRKWNKVIELLEEIMEKVREKARGEIRQQFEAQGWKVTCDVGGFTETVFLGSGGSVEMAAATATASASADTTSVSGGFSKRSRYYEFECEVMAWKWKGFELELGDYDLDLDLDLIAALLDAYAQRRKVII